MIDIVIIAIIIIYFCSLIALISIPEFLLFLPAAWG